MPARAIDLLYIQMGRLGFDDVPRLAIAAAVGRAPLRRRLRSMGGDAYGYACPASCRRRRSASRECESTDRSRSASAETLVHSGHGKSRPPHGSSEPADCTCADVGDCECSCMLGLYPPMAVALLSTAHPPISLDMALPAPILPASKLSRVF